jgi:hypothetical protein
LFVLGSTGDKKDLGERLRSIGVSGRKSKKLRFAEFEKPPCRGHGGFSKEHG